MIKFSILLLVIAMPAFATSIPVKSFDQLKLENLLRKIPSALSKTQDMGEFVRKTYTYPKEKRKGTFKIECLADHYLSAPLPSKVACSIDVPEEDLKYGEFVTTLSDASVVNNFYSAISYGIESKSFSSTERVFGKNMYGKNGMIFRYRLTCDKKTCLFSSTAQEE